MDRCLGYCLYRYLLPILGFAIALSAPSNRAQAEDKPAGMTPPRVTIAEVDWSAAIKRLRTETRNVPLGRSAPGSSLPRALARLNAAMSPHFPGITASPVPVLLPIDTTALLRDLATGVAGEDSAAYLSGFHASKFFFAGPAGYDAAFMLQTNEDAEFSDVAMTVPIEVQISGSALLYELDGVVPAGQPVQELADEFPGIRRVMHEFHLRYSFVRDGVPYVVSIGCFDGGRARSRLPTCRVADRVALRFLLALRMAGGNPQPVRVTTPPSLESPASLSAVFRYRSPGKLLAGTSFHDLGGRDDRTVYAPIRFPLAHAPAYINSQVFQRHNPTPVFGYPWRDNFCERRSFPVGQCPAGAGHQGQDIRPAACSPQPCRPQDQIVAVRDGMILRSPHQEAAYLFVNTATEHIRFRYLHMSPQKMNADGLLSGRVVREGEVIGEISNFSRRENGTSYHLHFDIQVPTRDGWVFVNPYMTLVAAYERLIGGRGTEVDDVVLAATGEPDQVVMTEPPPRPVKISRSIRHRHIVRSHHHPKGRYLSHGRPHKKAFRHRFARR